MPAKDFDRDYEHHPPRNEGENRQHAEVRRMFRNLAEELQDWVPEGRERSTMHTKLEEAMMWANAGIARSRYTG